MSDESSWKKLPVFITPDGPISPLTPETYAKFRHWMEERGLDPDNQDDLYRALTEMCETFINLSKHGLDRSVRDQVKKNYN
jgi:hypothetical protein